MKPCNSIFIVRLRKKSSCFNVELRVMQRDVTCLSGEKQIHISKRVAAKHDRWETVQLCGGVVLIHPDQVNQVHTFLLSRHHRSARGSGPAVRTR